MVQIQIVNMKLLEFNVGVDSKIKDDYSSKIMCWWRYLSHSMMTHLTHGQILKNGCGVQLVI